jgi:multicomponent Na+:H+ antiporter subunit F
MSEIVYQLFSIILGTAMLMAFVRLLKGPSLADRINAADVIAICTIGVMVGHGWYRKEETMLDIALVSGLVLFVGTTAISLFLPGEVLRKGQDD